MKRGDITHTAILDHTVKLLATGGPSFVSLRRIGQATNLAQSAVYHHFKNKDELLQATFLHLIMSLRTARASLPPVETTYQLLVQRLEFQFEQSGLIVATLKYFIDHRDRFPELTSTGYIPPAAYEHIIEVIEAGNQTGEFAIADPATEAKVIVHAINGFVLEYYPAVPSANERTQVIASVANFVWRALTNKG